jgi:dihydrofolate reductase
MAKVIMQASMSLDGFIAHEDDSVGPLFDWYGNGEVPFTGADPDRVFHVSVASADYLREAWAECRAGVVGRHLFDITNGWDGQPPVGEAEFVVTHSVPEDWQREHPDAPFTFITEGVAAAVEAALAYDPDGVIAVSPGNVGGQAIEAGLVDEVWIDLIPVVFGSGKRYFGDYAGAPLLLEDPIRVVHGNRVMHLQYRVRGR